MSRSEKILPYSKIQHVIILQGFWERQFGIANVKIQTARPSVIAQKGRVISDSPVIPALLKEDAVKIRDYMMDVVNRTKGTGIISQDN